MSKYDLGIIGGMGSEATVEIFSRIISRTKHSCDQEHMKICVLNLANIPDRTECIINNGQSPLPHINSAIMDLEKLDTEYFIISCNTAHYFAKEFDYQNKKIKFISLIDEALKEVKKKYKNVCVLCTTGTHQSGVYYKNKLANDLEFTYPTKEEQIEIMKVISDTKADVNRNIIKNNLKKIVQEISKRSDCVFLLACTELSLYLNDLKDYKVIDAMDCLVNAVIKKCGYEVKK